MQLFCIFRITAIQQSPEDQERSVQAKFLGLRRYHSHPKIRRDQFKHDTHIECAEYLSDYTVDTNTGVFVNNYRL